MVLRSSIEWEAYPALLATGVPGSFAKAQYSPSALLEIADYQRYFQTLGLASGRGRRLGLVI